MVAEIKKRGIFFCGNPRCILAPEIWRDFDGVKFGLCARHAKEVGWIKDIPIVQHAKPAGYQHSFLTRLLNSTDDALDGLFPMAEIKQPHWSDNDGLPF